MTQISTMVEIEKVISEQGLPLKDFMAKNLGSLISAYLPDHRNTPLRPEVMIAAMMSAGIENNCSMQKSVARINADRKILGFPPISSNTAAYSKAKSKIPNGLLADFAKNITQQTQAQTCSVGALGIPTKLIDGTTLLLDDSRENQEAYPQHGQQTDGVGFPIVRAIAIQSFETGMVENFAFGAFQGKGTGEMALARQVLAACNKADLLIGDAYYPSYFLLATLIEYEVQGLFPWDGKRLLDYRTGKSLGVLDHITFWQKPQRPSWMTKEEYDKFPAEIEIREFAHTLKGDKINFVTTLLDDQKFPKHELASHYASRWSVELLFRDLKTTMGLEHVHARTPDAVEKEIWATILGYNAVRWHQLQAKQLTGENEEQLSVKATINVIQANIPVILSAKLTDMHRILAGMYYEISQNKVGKRPGRAEPRMIKKRPKPRKKLKISRADWRKAVGLS